MGPMAYGRAFEDLRELGCIERTPHVAAADVAGTLAATVTDEAMPPVRCRTLPSIAASIPATQGTMQALEVLWRTHGGAVAWLDQCEGVWAEPAAGAPLAGIERLRRQGVICGADRVVALIAASGLKDPSPAQTSPASQTGSEWLVGLLRTLHQNHGVHLDD